jgi:hypothetical protein
MDDNSSDNLHVSGSSKADVVTFSENDIKAIEAALVNRLPPEECRTKAFKKTAPPDGKQPSMTFLHLYSIGYI